MSDLLAENILSVLGLCPPGSLLLPWIGQARAASGRPLGLPVRSCTATFAVAKRVAARRRSGAMDAPVAAILLEPEGDAEQAILIMLDWSHELGPHSSAALRGGDPKAIFGIDAVVVRRCLLVLTEDDTLPMGLLRLLSHRLQLSQQDLGWVGLRQLHEVLGEYLRRIPRERWRAPERTASELLARLGQLGIRPWHPLMDPPPALLTAGLPRLRRRYEPRRPGTVEFPWKFTAEEAVDNAALVLQAQLDLRRQGWTGAIGSKR